MLVILQSVWALTVSQWSLPRECVAEMFEGLPMKMRVAVFWTLWILLTLAQDILYNFLISWALHALFFVGSSKLTASLGLALESYGLGLGLGLVLTTSLLLRDAAKYCSVWETPLRFLVRFVARSYARSPYALLRQPRIKLSKFILLAESRLLKIFEQRKKWWCDQRSLLPACRVGWSPVNRSVCTASETVLISVQCTRIPRYLDNFLAHLSLAYLRSLADAASHGKSEVTRRRTS